MLPKYRRKKKIVIIQSNYIPWKGYFDLINAADVFVVYDEMQYTKNDWRNRNKIKTPQGVQWITIPVRQINLSQKINETQISLNNWNVKHWKNLTANYAKAKFFKEYKGIFENLYLNSNEKLLSDINVKFIKEINLILNINTEILWSHDFNYKGDKCEKLIDLCKQVSADEYITGPSAKGYLDVDLFEKENINVRWMNYNNYPEYNQLYQPFEHYVSILDLIFNVGSDAKKYMNSFTF